MRLTVPSRRRPGITLLEVLVSTAIFLFSLVAIGQLMNGAADQALEVNQLTKATRLCQSKLNEFIAGVQPVNSGGGGEFDEEPGWNWSAESTTESTAVNLYKVTVTVSHDSPRGKIEVVLSQHVFDPAQKGQLADTNTATDSSSSSGSSGSSSTGGASTGGSTSGGTTGGTRTGGTGGGGNTGGTGGGNTGGGGGGTRGKS